MHAQNQLPIPESVSTQRDAIELARVWAADGRQHIVISAEAWSDPAAWGILLVDIARHVAVAYQEANGGEVNEVLARVKAGFDAEWNYPTDIPPSGNDDSRGEIQ